jgi:hypothetical protein
MRADSALACHQGEYTYKLLSKYLVELIIAFIIFSQFDTENEIVFAGDIHQQDLLFGNQLWICWAKY